MHLPALKIISWLVKIAPKMLLRLYYKPQRIENGMAIAAHNATPVLYVGAGHAHRIQGTRLQFSNHTMVTIKVNWLEVEVRVDREYLFAHQLQLGLEVKGYEQQEVELSLDLPDSAVAKLQHRESGMLTLEGHAVVSAVSRDVRVPFIFRAAAFISG